MGALWKHGRQAPLLGRGVRCHGGRARKERGLVARAGRYESISGCIDLVNNIDS